ncbi:MAG: nucleoside-diphosphate kinase [Armatimonadota bacterium]
MQRTLVILKPDALQRHLVGRILQRFEDAQLQITAMRMLQPSRRMIERHYPDDEEFVARLGSKTLDAYHETGEDCADIFESNDSVVIGRTIRRWLVDYLCDGEVVAMIIVGERAVERVRALIGATIPNVARPGTIRGDLCTDTPIAACRQKRAVMNLVHASGTVQEAEDEIALWFPDEVDKQ